MKPSTPEPEIIHSMFNRGIDLNRKGALSEAEKIFRILVLVDPSQYAFVGLHGVTLTQQGVHEESIKYLIRAMLLYPKHAATRSNIGNAMVGLGRSADAMGFQRSAIVLDPSYEEFYRNYATAMGSLARQEEALASLDRAIELDFSSPEAHMNRGNTLKELERYEEALASHDRAIELKADLAEAHMNRGSVLQELKRYEEALASHDRAIDLKADLAEAHTNRGNTLRELKHYEEALASHDRAIDLKADLAEAHTNRGNTLRELKRYEEALASHDRAIDLKADLVEAYSNRGTALMELQRYEEALASFDCALVLKNDFADASWNKSTLLILLGRYIDGFSLYHSRFHVKDKSNSIRESKAIEYSGQDVFGKKIFIYPEQGFGDVIQFARYAKCLKDMGAHVVLQVPSSLSRLLSTMDENIKVTCSEAEPSDIDFICPLLNLPHIFKTTTDCIPYACAYLKPPKEKSSCLIDINASRNVGIVWAGNPKHRNDKNRSIPFEAFSKVLSVDLRFVALQKGIRAEDFILLSEFENVRVIQDQISDFADTSSVISGLDLVITVDTSVAHLAGAMGKETWILLPFMPDYRWLLERDDSPWYKSVKLYRQDESRKWDPVIDRVIYDLKKKFISQ